MQRVLTLLLASLAITMPGTADHITTPEQTVDAFFQAMRDGDAETLREMVHPEAELMRVRADGRIEKGDFQAWLSWVSEQDPGNADEQVFSLKTQSFGHLATVWAPFTLDYKAERVACGVNTFTLAKTETGWTVISLADVQADSDCKTFRSTYEAG